MKYNQLLARKTREPSTKNLAGGAAHQTSTKLEFVSMLLTAFLGNQFYREADATAARLKELVHSIPDKKFVAKAALYARKEAGMRSVTHLVAGELAQLVKGEEWTKDFYAQVVHRPDDILEILAYHMAHYGRPIPNSLKKGLGKAMVKFDAYQLAKYKRNSAALKLVDAVNLLHPPHTDAIGQLVDGSLAPAETWETKLTQAGQDREANAETLVENKADVWRSLLKERRLGYFALLRNLRNILEQAPELCDEAAASLVSRGMIRRSLVLPFRFRIAYDAINAAEGVSRNRRRQLLKALNKAVEISLENVPTFSGSTLVALDCSGSMIGKPMQIGALFAAVLFRTTNAELMLFANDARYHRLNPGDTTLSLAQQIEDQATWGGTNFHSVFQTASRRYDRVIILSDMQAWIGQHTPAKALHDYTRRVGHRPRIFSFDLAGYGSLQFPEADTYALAGFSDKTLETLSFLESDKHALLRTIERMKL